MVEVFRKRVFLIGLAVVLFGIGLVFAYSSAISRGGHGGGNVFIVINGNEFELQDAIGSGQFNMNYVGAGRYSASVDSGHGGEGVFVNVNGADKTFQEAINDGSLCSSSGGGSSNYSATGYLGHLGSDILVDINGEKTLQEAINAGDFAYNVWSPPRSGVCSTSTLVQTNCGNTRTVSGTRNCCFPSCAGKSCGGDGCGGSCGTCSPTTTISRSCFGNQIITTRTTCTRYCSSGSCRNGGCSSSSSGGVYCVSRICSGGVCTGVGTGGGTGGFLGGP